MKNSPHSLLLVSLLCMLVLSSCGKPCRHTEVMDPAVDATCANEGKTEGSHCSACGEVLTEQTSVPKVAHTPVTVKGVEPTCASEGKTEGSHCAGCGEILVAQTALPKTDHTPATDKAVAPTCASEGRTEGSHCAGCGEILVAQTVLPKTNHTPAVDKAVTPTCVRDGKTQGSHCSLCHEVLVPQAVIPATGHTMVIQEAVAPTCTSSGLTRGEYCSTCHYEASHQVTLSPIDHKYGSNGACTMCGHSPDIHFSRMWIDKAGQTVSAGDTVTVYIEALFKNQPRHLSADLISLEKRAGTSGYVRPDYKPSDNIYVIEIPIESDMCPGRWAVDACILSDTNKINKTVTLPTEQYEKDLWFIIA